MNAIENEVMKCKRISAQQYALSARSLAAGSIELPDEMFPFLIQWQCEQSSTPGAAVLAANNEASRDEWMVALKEALQRIPSVAEAEIATNKAEVNEFRRPSRIHTN